MLVPVHMSMVMQPPGRETGGHRKRVEDPKLVQGQGHFVDDIRLPGTVEVAFLRSPHAHARITHVQLDAARGVPSVLAAWSGEDVGGVPRMPNRIRFDDLNVSPLPPLARDSVTMVGYPVAAVVAAHRSVAQDAVDLVDVDY